MPRRAGCLVALTLLALSPGTLLLAFGAWVAAHGGGRAVMLAGAGFFALGLFVALVVGAAVRRSPR